MSEGNESTGKRSRVNKRWSEYPIGTIAHSHTGRCWEKTTKGWKAGGVNRPGDTFPTPGGDALEVTLPRETMSEASKTPVTDKRKSRGIEWVPIGVLAKMETQLTDARADSERLAEALERIMKEDEAPSHVCGPQQYNVCGSIATAALSAHKALNQNGGEDMTAEEADREFEMRLNEDRRDFEQERMSSIATPTQNDDGK